jgi:hypothetical protein
VKPTLEALAPRIEAVARGPDAVRPPLLVRLARPLLTAVGWAPHVRVDRTRALLDGLTTEGDAQAARRLDAAVAELADNVAAVEAAVTLARRPMMAHAAWLHRVHRTLLRARDADAAASVDPLALLAPLALRADDEEAPPADQAAVRTPPPDAAAGARAVGLELAAVDHLLAAAHDERDVLARRRRMFEAARQLLLEVSAALPLAREGVRARQQHVAREVTRIDRWVAAGAASEVALPWQAREAHARGEGRRLAAVLAALDATSAGAVPSRRALCARARAALWRGREVDGRASLRRSAEEMLGGAAVEATERGYREARAAVYARRRAGARVDDETVYLRGECVEETLRAAVAAGGCFEVGAALHPARVVEERRFERTVRFPAARMELARAEDVGDLGAAMIQDPRTVLLDLAAGRLLTRRYVREEVERRTRTVLRSEARVYVLDGSTSMLGPRARMRDALLVAELATVAARLDDPGDLRCVLWYRYFTDTLGPEGRVGTADEARAAIASVLATTRTGGTDITRAMLASLAQVRAAREVDPALAKAQVVLVTDGEATVDEGAILDARGALGELPLGVSVVALGQENVALRELVARQRARGDRAFYHYLDDATLARIVNGGLDGDASPHAPGDAPLAELGGLLEEVEALGRARDVNALEAQEAEAQALREAGAEGALRQGELARDEALRRDRRALDLRFGRWFPRAPGGAAAAPAAGTAERDDFDAARIALCTVVEVVRVVGGSPLSRRADAIEVFERLMPDAGLTPSRYHRLLDAYGRALARELAGLHGAAGGA